MANEIELAAEQVLGAGVIPRNEGMFDPISLPSGLDTRDYLRISQQSLADTRVRQSLVSSAMQDRVKQENAFRQLEASRREQSALQELYRLDTSDPDFGEKADMYAELAAYSPRVASALQSKQSKFTRENSALNSVAEELAKKRASDEEIDASLEIAKSLLNTRGPNSSMFLRWKTGLVRDASLKEQEEKLEFQKSRTSEEAALRKYTENMAILQGDVSQKLGDIPGLPDTWRRGDLLDIAFPETVEEEVTLTSENVDDYYLDGDPSLMLNKSGTFTRRPPNVKKKVLEAYDLTEEQRNAALALSDSSEDVFITDANFSDYVTAPGKDDKTGEEFKKYWTGSGRSVELSDAGERYERNREATLKDLHAKLKVVDDIPLNIRKFYNSSRIAQQKFAQERARRAAIASQTGIDVSGEDSEEGAVESFINKFIN